MHELIYLDTWTITLKSGVQQTVHAQSLDVQRGQDGAITGITTVDHEGLATSLVAVVPSEVAMVVKRRDQGTVKTAYRLAGKVEYVDAADTMVQEAAK